MVTKLVDNIVMVMERQYQIRTESDRAQISQTGEVQQSSNIICARSQGHGHCGVVQKILLGQRGLNGNAKNLETTARGAI